MRLLIDKQWITCPREVDKEQWKAEISAKFSDPSLPGEEWKPLKGYSRYEYSNFGRVRTNGYKGSQRVKVMKPAVSTDGYLKTMFKCEDGKFRTDTIHRVILRSEIPKPGPEYEVNHKNGIKTDNRPVNLEWMTRSQNCQHSFDTGLQKPKRGELNGMAKLTQKDVDFLRNEKRTKGRFWGRNEYAKQYGIAAKHLQKIVNSDNLW